MNSQVSKSRPEALLETLLRLTNEMISNLQIEDLDRVEQLLTERGTLIQRSFEQKDNINADFYQKNEAARKLAKQLNEQEQKLTIALQEFNKKSFINLQDAQKRRVVANYLK